MTAILFICWSPRKWNTEFVLRKIFDKVWWNKEFIALREFKISPCVWCWACEKTSTCALHDDMADVTNKLLAADIIVLGSPNHFANVSWTTKIFIDRTLACYHKKLLKNKNIILVATGHDTNSKDKKYIVQGTHGLVTYHKMKLLWSFGFCTEEAAFKESSSTLKQIEKIIKTINECSISKIKK